MPKPGIVTGQKVQPEKLGLAKALRNHMTPEEKLLWHKLRAGRFKGFHIRRQQIIQGFVADFYCHAADLVIELDGPIHNSQIAYDAERDDIFECLGLTVLRIRNEEVNSDLDGVLMRIERHLPASPLPFREGDGG